MTQLGNDFCTSSPEERSRICQGWTRQREQGSRAEAELWRANVLPSAWLVGWFREAAKEDAKEHVASAKNEDPAPPSKMCQRQMESS